MKTLFVTLISFISLTTVAHAQTATAPADVVAIKKAIADETDGYFNRNKEQWSNAWAHEPHMQWSGNGNNGSILLTNGWDAYEGQLGSNFTDTQPRPAAVVQRDNYQISVVGNAATAVFSQSLQVGTYSNKSREVRVLEKQGNAWKLVYVNSRNVE